MNEAAAGLQRAVDGLVNISTLEYVLNIANGHVEAGDVDKLVPSAKEMFNKVLASAQAVYDDPDATQEQVDTAWKTLMYAIQAMGFVPGDKTELIDLVAKAKALDLNAYEDGAEKDAFTAALQAAEDLIADDDAMELDIDAAYKALNDAMQNLIPKPAAGDKTELKKVIDEAEVKNSELDRYVDDAEAKQKFAEALAAAKEVYGKDGATQDEIDQAKNDLLDAMTGLRLRADKSNLEQWLEDLKAIDLSQYTEESAQVVRAVIAKAEALAAQDLDEGDQGLINAMVAEMAIAKAQLVPAVTEPEDPKPGDGSGESPNPDSSKPGGNASSQDGTGSEGKEATDEVPTTGDSAPIAALAMMAAAAIGTAFAKKKRER